MFDKIAEIVAPIVVKVLRAEYEQQGHKLTGSLSASLEPRIVSDTTSAVIEVLMLEYGRYISDGVAANRIPYSPGSGAKTSKYIQGLTDFAQKRFSVGEKEAVGIAFAIARKHKKEGMPTKGSFQYSRNGRRTGAIEAAFDSALPEIADKLRPIIGIFVFELIKPI